MVPQMAWPSQKQMPTCPLKGLLPTLPPWTSSLLSAAFLPGCCSRALAHKSLSRRCLILSEVLTGLCPSLRPLPLCPQDLLQTHHRYTLTNSTNKARSSSEDACVLYPKRMSASKTPMVLAGLKSLMVTVMWAADRGPPWRGKKLEHTRSTSETFPVLKAMPGSSTALQRTTAFTQT